MPHEESQARIKDLVARIRDNIREIEMAVYVLGLSRRIPRNAVRRLETSVSRIDELVASEKEQLPRVLRSARKGLRQEARPPHVAEWREDRDSLVNFLEDTLLLAKYLAEHRVPRTDRQMFVMCFPDVDRSVDSTIAKLRKISSEKHPLFRRLAQSGLTSHNLSLKLRELRDAFGSSSVLSALRIARRILGSLVKDIPFSDLFKEFLETLEERLKRGADDELIQLDIFGKP